MKLVVRAREDVLHLAKGVSCLVDDSLLVAKLRGTLLLAAAAGV